MAAAFPVKAQKVMLEETGEVELYCHSQLREKKEQAIQDSFSEKYEAALDSLTGFNGLTFGLPFIGGRERW